MDSLHDYIKGGSEPIKTAPTPLNELELALGEAVTDEEFYDRYLTTIL
tara:strand:+ start:37991 stop:38134 length:144 start_codon:yes stop_codon:yes gene_type:complete